MQVGQALLQRWRDSETCWVPWVQTLATSQTAKSAGLSQSRTSKRVWKKYLRKRSLTWVKAKIHLVAAISSREYQEDYICTKMSDWVSEVVQLEKFAQTRSTGMLCCFHLRLKTSVDSPPKNQDLPERLVNPVSLLVIIAITESNFNQSD